MTTITKGRRRGLSWLALALLVALASANDAWAGWPTPITPMPPLDGPEDGSGAGGGTDAPPKAPIDAQKCFDAWLENAKRCKLEFCGWFLGLIPIDVCGDEYDDCVAKADDVYHCCRHPHAEECSR